MNRNLLCTLIALLVLALASSYSTTHASPLVTDENTLKMLRNYMQQYEPELADLNNYVAIDEMRSSKRGLGPRPLRFG